MGTPGGIGPLVPGIIGGRGPIVMPGGPGCGPGIQPATVPGIPGGMPGMPGPIIGIGPRGALMLDAADAENGDIGGMSATVPPADIRPPAPAVALLLALAGISSKPVHDGGIIGPATFVSLTGLNISAMSVSVYNIKSQLSVNARAQFYVTQHTTGDFGQ